MGWIFLSIALQLSSLSLLKLMALSATSGTAPASVPGMVAQGMTADIVQTVFHPLFMSAFVLLALQTLAWQLALKRYPLGYAFTFQALIYPAGMALGVLAFHDVLTWSKLAGVALIVTGVVLNARAT